MPAPPNFDRYTLQIRYADPNERHVVYESGVSRVTDNGYGTDLSRWPISDFC